MGDRRTMALRGPGAGGFTPAHSVAASNPCLNCGTNVQLAFCPECGQPEIDSDPTLKEFLHELAEEFLHWDGKLATTFRLLVTRPGALTNEYLEGRRIRYISPLRVYLTCSVLFFFLGAFVPGRVAIDREGHPYEVGIVQVGQASDKEIASMQEEARTSGPVLRWWLPHLARAIKTPGELRHATMSAVPRAMFVLVPLFAALIGIVYRDRRRKYPQHLAFALHVHAMLFLALTIMLASHFVPSLVVSSLYEILVLTAFAAYLVAAARRVYNGSTAQAIGRLALACSMHFVAFIGVLAATFALVVLSW